MQRNERFPSSDASSVRVMIQRIASRTDSFFHEFFHDSKDGSTTLNNPAEAVETISACAKIIEGYADEQRELWAVVAALRSCEDWMTEHLEGSA